ncbi:DUF6572 domain-containing protein [Aquirhabdus parva]|uniref:Uncharacterized protein n=1 Tax=Aquirhabdus parva TaxID=2283318 RepID=A0A345PBS0_9GAMM|nr:DUF6572 domain-containing protein [Aquirhabdus parva]AXI04729.1 hypothetical protein HYN46_14995 [Aquirhabdus parva]
MTVDQTEIVDAISINKLSEELVLTILDSLEWGSSKHLLLLQEKINAYLRFIESGEVFDTYPEAKGRRILFNIVLKYQPDENARNFLEHAKVIVESADISFKYEIFNPS